MASTKTKKKKTSALDIVKQKAALFDQLMEYIIERDPDAGLELRASFEDELRQSMISRKAGKMRPFDSARSAVAHE